MSISLRNLIWCASPIAAGSTIREHLTAINCEDIGTGEQNLHIVASGCSTIVEKSAILIKEDKTIIEEEKTIITERVDELKENNDGIC